MKSKGTDLLHEIVPAATSMAVLLNPKYGTVDPQSKEIEEASRAIGLRIQIWRRLTERLRSGA
jgi:putative tryptophan/tyrosine transport system substrate-binding protein